MGEIPDHVLDRYRNTLDRFAMRARRIEAHSLFSDRNRFRNWVEGAIHLTVDGDGQGEIRFDVPPEEAFESLAARVRPLLLEQDGLHHKQVLAALGAFVRHDTELREQRETLQGMWKQAAGSTMVAFQLGEVRDGAPAVADAELAHGWLYGDLVHAKPDVSPAVLRTSIDMRFIAAVVVYGRAAVATVATLNVIRQAADNGLFGLSPAALTGRVVVSTPLVKRMASVAAT